MFFGRRYAFSIIQTSQSLRTTEYTEVVQSLEYTEPSELRPPHWHILCLAVREQLDRAGRQGSAGRYLTRNSGQKMGATPWVGDLNTDPYGAQTSANEPACLLSSQVKGIFKPNYLVPTNWELARVRTRLLS
jgi:hypothetical protein